MLALKDLMDLLDRWDTWKTTRENAAKVPALEAKITELEGLLSGEVPPDFCRKCGKRAARMTGSPNLEKGMIGEHWHCTACNMRDLRWRKA